MENLCYPTQQDVDRTLNAAKGTSIGFAVLTWSNECPASSNRDRLLEVVKALPQDMRIYYFKTIKKKSVVAPGWSHYCQIFIGSREYSGTIDKPQCLKIETGVRLTIDVNNNVE